MTITIRKHDWKEKFIHQITQKGLCSFFLYVIIYIEGRETHTQRRMKNMLKIDYHKIPANVNELIARMDSTDNREVARKARAEIKKFDEALDNGKTPEFSEGLIDAVKKAIMERNRMNAVPSRSAEEARIDRILNIRDSNGRATARRFN